MVICSGIRADGGRCRAQAMRNSEWCIGHDPHQAEARRRRASKGGKRGGRGRPQVEVNAVKTQLQDLVEGVLGGKIERADAAVVGQVLNVYLRAVSVELQVREQMDLTARLEELENLLAQRDGTQSRGA